MPDEPQLDAPQAANDTTHDHDARTAISGVMVTRDRSCMVKTQIDIIHGIEPADTRDHGHWRPGRHTFPGPDLHIPPARH